MIVYFLNFKGKIIGSIQKLIFNKEIRMIKKSIKIFLLGLAAQSFAFTALAEGFEIGAGGLTISGDGVSTTSGGVNVGYRFSDNLALEFGAYTGGSDDISEGGVAAVLEIDSVITGRVKYGMSLGDKASGYLSAGYSNVGISAAACAVGTCFADSDDVSGATLGLGVDFKFGQKWGGTVEFVRGLGDLEDSNVGVFSVKYFLD